MRQKSKHRQVKEGWVFPAIPEGYSKAVVLIGSSGNVMLVFSDDAPAHRASLKFAEELKERWEWPWVTGFTPDHDDWTKIGFSVGIMRDTCFGRPDENSMFKDWVNKG